MTKLYCKRVFLKEKVDLGNLSTSIEVTCIFKEAFSSGGEVFISY